MAKEKSTKPQPPKKALTAFFIYKADKFPETKKAHPDAKVTELTKIISQGWNSIGAEEKTKYEKKHEEAKKKYESDLAAYEEEHGPIEKKTRKSSKKGEKSKGASKKAASKPKGKAKKTSDDEDDDDEGDEEEDDEEDDEEEDEPVAKKAKKSK